MSIVPESQQPAEGEAMMRAAIESYQAPVLEIGPGEGRWGRLLRGRVPSIAAVEIWPPYIEQYGLRALYDRLDVADGIEAVKSLPDEAGGWVVILSDVLEHFTRPRGLELLDELKARVGAIFLTLPISPCVQDGAVYGNPYETHLDQWSHDEVLGQGFVLMQRGFNPNGLVEIGTYRWERAIDLGEAFDRRMIDKDERIRVIRSLLPTGDGAALDIGCGGPEHTALFEVYGDFRFSPILGVDGCQSVIEARSKANRDIRFVFRHERAEQLFSGFSIPSEPPFAVVTALHMLEHLAESDVAEVVRHLKRLAPVVIVETPDQYESGESVVEATGNPLQRHKQLLTSAKMRALGFVDVAHYWQNKMFSNGIYVWRKCDQ